MIKFILKKSIGLIPWRIRPLIKRVPLVSSLQRLLIKKFLTGYEFVHRIDCGPAEGLTFPVVMPDDKNVWTGTYESDFVSAITSAVVRDSVCLDIGGWRGYCGGAMACTGAGKVYIFEPLLENQERIKKMIALNPGLAIELVSAAVGSEDGKANFAMSEATSMGKLTTSSFRTQDIVRNLVEVSIIKLDSWIEERGVTNVSVVKIDVEGAELEVLNGARRLLQDAKPRLFIESHTRELTMQISILLNSCNYRLRTLETNMPPNGRDEPDVCHIVAE